jgi:hypothetical protein
MSADIHPVRERADLPLEQRVQRLEILLARLWDQAWWTQLSETQRQQFEREGFSAPIQQFYQDIY